MKLFLVNNGLTVDQAKLLGTQANRYPDLIGSLVPNDEEGGYLMLKELIRLHPPVAPGQMIDLLAFSGLKVTPSAQLREQGMRRALAEHPEVRLRQLVYGGWTRQRAYEQAKLLLKRYPHTSLVWAANDEMAFGVMQAYVESWGSGQGCVVRRHQQFTRGIASVTRQSPERLAGRAFQSGWLGHG